MKPTQSQSTILTSPKERPKKKMAAPPTPGLLLIQARISAPDVLTPDVFEEWYNTVHVRDIMATGEVTAAVRYRAAAGAGAAEKGLGGLPYMALYPTRDTARIASAKESTVWRCPLHSDVLPHESKFIMDVAAFEAKVFERVVSRGRSDLDVEGGDGRGN